MKNCTCPFALLADSLYNLDHPSKLGEDNNFRGLLFRNVVFLAPLLDLLDGSLGFRALQYWILSVYMPEEDVRMLKTAHCLHR